MQCFAAGLARIVISEFLSSGVPNRTLLVTQVCHVLSNDLAR